MKRNHTENPRKESYTTSLFEMVQWKRSPAPEYTPKEWALTRMMAVAKFELARIEEAKETDYEIGLTKRHIDAFKKLNNELVDRFNATGGDASANFMETDPKYQD